jgi:uncharacterized UBP type Zn finger protein
LRGKNPARADGTPSPQAPGRRRSNGRADPNADRVSKKIEPWRGMQRSKEAKKLPPEKARQTMAKKCKHLNQIKVTNTDIRVCEECVKLGDTWVHLRLCISCGNVGCCDSSKNKHATKHFHASKHPVMRSIEPGEDWIWCYVDEMIAGEVAA